MDISIFSGTASIDNFTSIYTGTNAKLKTTTNTNSITNEELNEQTLYIISGDARGAEFIIKSIINNNIQNDIKDKSNEVIKFDKNGELVLINRSKLRSIEGEEIEE